MASDEDAVPEVPHDDGEAEPVESEETSPAPNGTDLTDPSKEMSETEEVASAENDEKPPAEEKEAEAVSTNTRKRSATETSDPDELPSDPTVEASSYAEVSGVYAPLLRLRNKRELDEIPVVPLPPRTIGGLRDQIEKQKQCNCKRSHCLKLYCECFASGIHCSPMCNCVSCHNNEECGSNDRNESILMTLERNQHAFRPRIIAIAGAAASVAGAGLTAVHGDSTTKSSNRVNNVLSTPGGAHSMTGCNCKKSFCLKKYCECFHAAVYCNPPHCRCTDCQNTEGNPKREKLVAKRRSQAEAAAAAAALAHQHSRLAHMSGRMAMMGDAGRTYYGAEHPSSNTVGGVNNGDVEHTAAAAMAAGAAAGGVDVFLPPSSYAVPMQLRNGTSYAALSFGTAGPRSMGQSASDAANSPTPSTPSKQTPSRAKKPRKRPRTQIIFPLKKQETELEKSWRLEVDRAKMTFVKIREQLKWRAFGNGETDGSHAGPHPPQDAPTENSIYLTPSKKVERAQLIDVKEKGELPIQANAAAIIASVESELQGLAGAWKAAEPLAVEMIESAHDTCNGASAIIPLPVPNNDDPAVNETEPMDIAEKSTEAVALESSETITDETPHDPEVQDVTSQNTESMDVEEKKPEGAVALECSETITNGTPQEPDRQDVKTQNMDNVQNGDIVQNSIASTTENASTKENEMQPVDVTDRQTESISEVDLICAEEIPEEAGRYPLSDAVVRELTILAAQDASLIRELAQTVRSKALEMAKARIRYATDTSGDNS